MEAYDAVGENNFNPSSSYGGNARQNATWSPYDNNGGTVMAVAGEDYVICAADTRMSTGYSIMTRHYTKVDEMSSKTLMASAGFMADAATLKKLLKRASNTSTPVNKPIGCVAFAQMLAGSRCTCEGFFHITRLISWLGWMRKEKGQCLRTTRLVVTRGRIIPVKGAGNS